MNDKIKIQEKLAICRLLLSFSLLAIFGIVGWIYRIYEAIGFEQTKFSLIVLLTFVFITIIIFHKIIVLIKKL